MKVFEGKVVNFVGQAVRNLHNVVVKEKNIKNFMRENISRDLYFVVALVLDSIIIDLNSISFDEIWVLKNYKNTEHTVISV